MGYLDGSTITVDAILTNEGRKKLAQGAGLGITKFSLSDDGIDYKLWNPNHASGSTYYGEAINELPNLEAVTDSHIGMRYHLLTMDRDRVFLPNLDIDPSSILISKQGPDGAKLINVVTLNHPAEQYNFKIFDASAIVVDVMTHSANGQTAQFNAMQEMPDTQIAGPATQLKVMALPLTHKVTTAIEIYGIASGAVNYCTVTATSNIREYPVDNNQGVVS